MSRDEDSRPFDVDQFHIPDHSEMKRGIREIEVLNTKLEVKLKAAARQVFVAYKRDSRWSTKLDTAMSAYSEVLWAGLQSIPVFGGYFMLVKKVLQNPVTGLHHVMRTSYGSGSIDGKGWSVFGAANSNGVMSPLTYSDPHTSEDGVTSGIEGFNIANGRVGAFSDNKALRLQQFESDMADLVKDPLGLSIPNSSSAMAQRNVVMQKSDYKNKAYIAWRGYVLRVLESFDENSWIYYSLAMSIMAMEGSHEGLDDLGHGVYKNSEGRLGWDESKTYKVSSHRSNLHLVVTKYNKNIAKGIYDSKFFQWKSRSSRSKGIKSQRLPVFDNNTIYRVEREKAEIVAYYSDVRGRLAETLADHVHGLMVRQQEAEFFLPPKDQRSGCSTAAVVLTVLIPIRVLAVVMPKKIYNARTTLSSKDWARNICALSVFYRILYAYFDKQFVCDDLPSKRSLHFFIAAFSDAYNTALEYFCHQAFGHSYRDPTWLAVTLKQLLRADPAISTYLVSVQPFKEMATTALRSTTVMPGLQGFTHLKACPSPYSIDIAHNIAAKASTDRYSRDHSRPISYWGEILTLYFNEVEEGIRKSFTSMAGVSTGESNLRGHTFDGRAPHALQAEALTAKTPHGQLRQALGNVLADESVPANLRHCLLAIYKVLKPPM